MAMAGIWTLSVIVSVLYGFATGTASQVGAAALEGAAAAVTLCISIGGIICLWSGVMEVMNRCGLSASLSRLLRPLLSRLFPGAGRDPELMNALAQNVSANLLGLGNAATPAGLKAAKGLLKQSGGSTASNELCRLVVMNTASIQLIPTTIAALRSAHGAQNAFDILPAVWISSTLSVCAGLICSLVLQGIFPREGKGAGRS